MAAHKAADLVGSGTNTYKSLIHPDDQQRIWNEVQEAVGQGTPFRLTYRILAADGREKWVFEQGVRVSSGANQGMLQGFITDITGRICDPDGHSAHYEGFVTDITQRKRTEAARHESDRRFRGMLENVQLVSAMLDQGGNITFCNDFFLRLTGWKRDEIMGQNWCELFVPPEQYNSDLFSSQVAKRAVPPHHENEIITKTGQRRMISWNNTLLLDVAGNPIGVATIGEDITERLHLENELRQAQKLESIGRMAGGVAHDFNNHRHQWLQWYAPRESESL
jgi:PAS domain S-box-containing protein